MFITGCFISDLLGNDEKSYPVDISLPFSWKLDIGGEGAVETLVIDNIGYRLENDTSGLVAFSLDTGEIKWRIEVESDFDNNPLFVDGYLALFTFKGTHLLLIDPENGEIKKRIHLTLDGEIYYTQTDINQFKPTWIHIMSNNTSIYWGTAFGITADDKLLGLATLDVTDITEIDEESSPNEYIGIVNIIYENDLSIDETVSNKVYIENDIVYFGSYPKDWEDYSVPRFRSLDLITGEILWETTPKILFGGRSFVFNNYGNNFFLSDPRGFGLLDKQTGELYYEKSPGSGNTSGGFIVNNLFYSSNDSSNSSGIDLDNILCVDMDTGEKVWSYMSANGSLGSRPVVYYGLLFVACQVDLKIFDAITGELLCINDQIFGGHNQMNRQFIYKDKYMILDGESRIFCIDLEETAKRIR